MATEALIGQVLRQFWPQLQDGLRWTKAQVQVESGGDPLAVSPVGARGLLQLMPGTAADLGVTDPFDPEQNLSGGIRYLREQYERFPEILLHGERLLWAFAAYNGGHGYCSRALKLAHLDEEPEWWKWETGRFWLMHRNCLVVSAHGQRYPDYRQMWAYVAKVVEAFAEAA